MSFSLTRGLIFILIGLPIGFILSALGFAVMGIEISAPAIAPYAALIAVLIGLAAAFWKTEN